MVGTRVDTTGSVFKINLDCSFGDNFNGDRDFQIVLSSLLTQHILMLFHQPLIAEYQSQYRMYCTIRSEAGLRDLIRLMIFNAW